MVHHTLPPGLTLWMLNGNSRPSTAVGQLGVLGSVGLVSACFFLSSPVFIHWRVVEQAFSLSSTPCNMRLATVQFCRSSRGLVPCSWAPWQVFFFFFLIDFSHPHVNRLSVNHCPCFNLFKWGSLRNATLQIFFYPLPHIFLPCFGGDMKFPLLSTPW